MIIPTSCVFIPRGHRVAVVHSKKHGGRVELLGGKGERGESPEETACRESFEEGGVEIVDPVAMFTSDDPSPDDDEIVYHCTFFRARVAPDAELVSSTEGRAEWVVWAALLRGTYAVNNQRTLAAYRAWARHAHAELRRRANKYLGPRTVARLVPKSGRLTPESLDIAGASIDRTHGLETGTTARELWLMQPEVRIR